MRDHVVQSVDMRFKAEGPAGGGVVKAPSSQAGGEKADQLGRAAGRAEGGGRVPG